MIRANIVGASGYTGGELLRLLLDHPGVEIQGASSQSLAGKPVGRAHPNLRGRTDRKFVRMEQLEPADVAFFCLPHGTTSDRWDELSGLAPKILDLSADFRLRDPGAYEKHYHRPHPRPELLAEFVYGLPELNREAIREARYVACGGCNATATILGLYPLARAGVAFERPPVVEVKAGSSEAGRKISATSHHPERSGSVRAFAPTGHRHTAEIAEALGNEAPAEVHLTVTSVEMVRGAVATSHVFPASPLGEKEVWGLYRDAFRDEPFMRLVKERRGSYRYPDPKLLAGTNYADVGFDVDPDSGRLVVVSAIDNLVKGAAGQAVQCLNVMHGLDETTALGFPGLHPL